MGVDELLPSCGACTAAEEYKVRCRASGGNHHGEAARHGTEVASVGVDSHNRAGGAKLVRDSVKDCKVVEGAAVAADAAKVKYHAPGSGVRVSVAGRG